MAIPLQQFPATPSVLSGAQAGASLAEQLQKMHEEGRMEPFKEQLAKGQVEQLPLREQLLRSQAGLAGEQEKWLPITNLLKASQQAQTSSRFGPVFRMSQWVRAKPAAAKALWLAQNPEKAKMIDQVLGNQIMAGQKTSPTADLINQLIGKMYPGMAQAQPQGPQQSMPGAPQQLPKGPAQQPQGPGQQQGPAAPSQGQMPKGPAMEWKDVPEPVMKSALTDDEQQAFIANRYGAGPGKTWENASSSMGAERMLAQNRDRYSKMFNLASQYAGTIGRGKQLLDQFTNQNPDAVEAYRQYKTAFSSTLKNIIKRIENMGATDSQRAELGRMVNQIDDLKSNPEQAKRGMNNFVRIIGEVAQQNYDRAEPFSKGLFKKMSGSQGWEQTDYLKASSGWSGNIYTAKDGKKYTREQIMGAAGGGQ